MVWSKENTLKLIELLRLKVGLWRKAPTDSRHKNKKKDHIRFMAAMLDVKTKEIERKVENLKSHYSSEKTKERCKSRFYKSKWYAYKHLDFLRMTRSRTSKKFKIPVCNLRIYFKAIV